MLKGRGKREKRNGRGEFLVAVFPRLRYGGGLNDGGTAMSHAQHAHSWPRRRFMSVCGTAVCSLAARRARADAGGEELACFGIVADCHYAERDDKQGVRAYRESVNKLAECVAQMNLQGVGALIELVVGKGEANNAYAVVRAMRDGRLVITGFRTAPSRVLTGAPFF